MVHDYGWKMSYNWADLMKYDMSVMRILSAVMYCIFLSGILFRLCFLSWWIVLMDCYAAAWVSVIDWLMYSLSDLLPGDTTWIPMTWRLRVRLDLKKRQHFFIQLITQTVTQPPERAPSKRPWKPDTALSCSFHKMSGKLSIGLLFLDHQDRLPLFAVAVELCSASVTLWSTVQSCWVTFAQFRVFH